MRSRLGVPGLLAILHRPAEAQDLSGAGWSDLIAAARSSNLLGALAEVLQAAGVAAPEAAARHLAGARQLGGRQRLSVRWEAHCLQEALGGLGVPIVLLKGAAYVLGYPALAEGRLFGDIDILVPRPALGDVESRLMLAGWSSSSVDPYDERYYRQWMHELPPMVHVHRGTVLDVHHTILPLSARRSPDPQAIIERARPVPGLPGLRVPCPEDLLIHSITHLMHEGELHNGLRDLHDIDRMVASFATVPGFWQQLVQMAAGSDLAPPVAAGLSMARSILGSKVPQEVLARLDSGVGWRRRAVLHAYRCAMRHPTPRRRPWQADFAHGLVYLRGHWLRMRPWQLARHLATKAWKGVLPRPA